MKKQIVSLALSAAIFTTNPLFAMESEVEDQMFSAPTASYTMSIAKLRLLLDTENGVFTVGKRQFNIRTDLISDLDNLDTDKYYLEKCAPEALVYFHSREGAPAFSTSIPIVLGEPTKIKAFFLDPEYRKRISTAMHHHALVTLKVVITPLEDPK